MLAASRLNLTGAALKSLIINIHKAPGSSRVGSGANPCSFVPQHYFSTTGATKNDFEAMALNWHDVSHLFFASIQPNGLVAPRLFTNSSGTYDLGVAMAAATCIHPSHREFGVTSGRPRVVGFFDCVAHAELMQAQGPYCSISAFDRGDDYDEYGVCIAYVFVHPEGKQLTSNGRVFKSGSIIKAGEQLPTQQILSYCHCIVKKASASSRGGGGRPLSPLLKSWVVRIPASPVGPDSPGPPESPDQNHSLCTHCRGGCSLRCVVGAKLPFSSARHGGWRNSTPYNCQYLFASFLTSLSTSQVSPVRYSDQATCTPTHA